MTRCCQVVFQAVVQWESRIHAYKKVEPPSDADIAEILQQSCRRVIRTLRWLGYLETGIDAMATGYDSLRDDEPEIAHTMAASVKQRITFGERAGHSRCGALGQASVMKGTPARNRAPPHSTGLRTAPAGGPGTPRAPYEPETRRGILGVQPG